MNNSQKSAAQRNRDRMMDLGEGSGMIWRNKEKELGNPDHEKWCDFKGQCNVAGVHYWVSGWINVSAKGFKYLGLKFERRQARNLKQEITNDN